MEYQKIFLLMFKYKSNTLAKKEKLPSNSAALTDDLYV